MSIPSEKIFKILKGFGYQLSVYDESGNDTYDPLKGVRFFVKDPNLMVTIVDNEITLNKSSEIELKDIELLTKQLKNVAREYMMRYTLKVFGKSISPKDFSFQAKTTRDKNKNKLATMESVDSDLNIDDIVRSQHLLIDAYHESKKEPAHLEKDSTCYKALYYCLKDLVRAESEHEDNKATGLISHMRSLFGQLGEKGKKYLADVSNSLQDLDTIGKLLAITWSSDDYYHVRKKRAQSMNNVTESMLGKLFGRTKTSYQRLGEVKIIYKHKIAVNEEAPSSRIRNIKSIALEHAGRKYAYPCVHIDGARAMARHLTEGGLFEDLVGMQILETSLKHKKLVEFVKYAKRNKLVSEGNENVYGLIEKKVQQIKNDLREFVSSRDYDSQRTKFESIRLAELQTDRVAQLKDDFTVKHFDQQLEDILPVINNILQEKEDYETALLEEIGKGLIFNRSASIPSALTFENAQARFAYYLEETANCLENVVVSAFMRQISEKLIANEELEDFEINALKEAFSHMTRIDNTPRPISVVKQFENRIFEFVDSPDFTELPGESIFTKHHGNDSIHLQREAEYAKSHWCTEKTIDEHGITQSGSSYNGKMVYHSPDKEVLRAKLHNLQDSDHGQKMIVDVDVQKNDTGNFAMCVYYVDRHRPNVPDSYTELKDPYKKFEFLEESDESDITFDPTKVAYKHRSPQLQADIDELERELGRPLTPDEREMLGDDTNEGY